MFIVLLFLLIGVLAYLYWQRRTTTLTRHCRWRASREQGEGHYHCVSCGGIARTGDGKTPRDCVARSTRKSD